MAPSLTRAILLLSVASSAAATTTTTNTTTTTASTSTTSSTTTTSTPLLPRVETAFSVTGPNADIILNDAASTAALATQLAIQIAAGCGTNITAAHVLVNLSKVAPGTLAVPARRLAVGNLNVANKIIVPAGTNPAVVAALQANFLGTKAPSALVAAFNAAIAKVPALVGQAANGATVTQWPCFVLPPAQQCVPVPLVTTTSTWTAWDSSSGSSDSSGNSLGSLSGVNASSDSSNSLHRGSSVSGSSLPGRSSGDSSGSNASGSSGSYLQIWQWVLLLGLFCCCKGGCIGAIAAGQPKKSRKYDEEEALYEEVIIQNPDGSEEIIMERIE